MHFLKRSEMKRKELRTIFWDEENRSVVMIDQTLLPSRLRYVKFHDYKEVGEAIKKMIIRGAPAIGVAAAMGIALCAVKSKARTKEELLHELEEAADYLSKTRPTAVNLFWAIDRMMKFAKNVEGDVEEIKEAILQEALRMAEEDIKVNRQIGHLGADLIEDGDKVLTLCK